MRRWLLLLILFLPVSALAQVGVWPEPVLDQNGKPVANASVAVCNNIPTFVFPCGGTTQVTLFSSFSGGAVPGNIIFTDQFGRAPVYAAAGNYYMQVVKAGFVSTVTPITIGVATSGANILPTNNVFTGTNNFTFPVTFTSTAAVTSAGIFTSGPNLYLKSILNGCDPSTQFNAYNLSTAFTESSTYCVLVPATANQTQVNAVGAYVENQTGGSGPGSDPSVALYGQARATVNGGGHAWGINAVALDSPGVTSGNLYPAEFDFKALNAGTAPHGILINGLFSAQTANGIAFDVATTQQGACTVCTWDYGLRFEVGTTLAPALGKGAIYLNPLASGVNKDSQGIAFISNDPVAGNNVVGLSEAAGGDLQIKNTVTGKGLLAPNVNAGGDGPGPNNRCKVDGITHVNISACMGLQGGTSGLRSLNTFTNIPEDITTNPATTNQAFELHLGTASVKSSVCDTTNKNCWISEVPMIMGPGSSIWGDGPIVTSNPEFSAGTAWVTGNNWFPPLGVPTIATPTCSSTGTGALSNGTYFIWVRTANNLQTNGGPAVAGPSMHTAEFAVTCAGGTATQAINIPIPSAVGNSPFQAQDFQIAASATSGTELEQATNTAGSPTPLSCTAGVVSTFNGVNYGCKMAGGTAATLNGPLQTGTRSFQDTDLSNVAFVLGPSQTVSFTYMITGLSANCGPIGSAAVYNPPNWLIWNQSGEELKGLNPFGLSLDGPCGGYSGGAASSPGGGTPTTGGSANPFSGGLVYEDTKTPNGISEHIKTGGNGPNCGSTCAGTTLTLTQASAASGVATTYTGTITGGAANALANTWVGIKGFTNSANNGEVFYVLSSTATTLVVINPSGIAEVHAGTATEATPFYPFYFDGRADGTGGAAGVPRIVNDITSAPKNAGSYIPAVFYVTGFRARIHFSNIHIETNQPVTSDGIQCTNGAYCLLDGVEGQNATVGILAHLTASGGFMGGYGLCPIGTAGSSQDRCLGSGQTGTAATFKDDTPGGQKLLGFVGHFSSLVANFKFVGLAPMTFANLSAIYPCAAGTEGYEGSVTDDNTALAFNATITGGGTNHVHAYCNGTNWVMQ